MKLLAAFVAVSFQIAQARRLQTADTVPTYTPEECDVWLAGGSAFDTDASGGLSSDEYFAVLSSLGLTTVAQSYSDLTFEDKMVFASLACSCVSLGMGEDCCSGDDAEIPLSVLSTVGDPAVDAYKADLCNLLATVILEETASPVAAPVTTPPPGVVAAPESPVAVLRPPRWGAVRPSPSTFQVLSEILTPQKSRQTRAPTISWPISSRDSKSCRMIFCLQNQ